MTAMDAGRPAGKVEVKAKDPKAAIARTFDEAAATVSRCSERVSLVASGMRGAADQVYGGLENEVSEALPPPNDGSANVLGSALEFLSRQIEFLETETARLCADGS